ncbi:hypothetical protein ACLOJK_024345 [Asimina triloba]
MGEKLPGCGCSMACSNAILYARNLLPRAPRWIWTHTLHVAIRRLSDLDYCRRHRACCRLLASHHGRIYHGRRVLPPPCSPAPLLRGSPFAASFIRGRRRWVSSSTAAAPVAAAVGFRRRPDLVIGGCCRSRPDDTWEEGWVVVLAIPPRRWKMGFIACCLAPPESATASDVVAANGRRLPSCAVDLLACSSPSGAVDREDGCWRQVDLVKMKHRNWCSSGPL